MLCLKDSEGRIPLCTTKASPRCNAEGYLGFINNNGTGIYNNGTLIEREVGLGRDEMYEGSTGGGAGAEVASATLSGATPPWNSTAAAVSAAVVILLMHAGAPASSAGGACGSLPSVKPPVCAPAFANRRHEIAAKAAVSCVAPVMPMAPVYDLKPVTTHAATGGAAVLEGWELGVWMSVSETLDDFGSPPSIAEPSPVPFHLPASADPFNGPNTQDLRACGLGTQYWDDHHDSMMRALSELGSFPDEHPPSPLHIFQASGTTGRSRHLTCSPSRLNPRNTPINKPADGHCKQAESSETEPDSESDTESSETEPDSEGDTKRGEARHLNSLPFGPHDVGSLLGKRHHDESSAADSDRANPSPDVPTAPPCSHSTESAGSNHDNSPPRIPTAVGPIVDLNARKRARISRERSFNQADVHCFTQKAEAVLCAIRAEGRRRTENDASMLQEKQETNRLLRRIANALDKNLEFVGVLIRTKDFSLNPQEKDLKSNAWV
ncbi:hypothetical protein GGX14DRAFT_661237 [Mycena pura]|uniref:Uncharacterized protein n=1 Tax=Mycena pura TaxID=153505 RepID=A0AAD6V896_9AGAR|nr:hypothetical protein GGX14DRAFT_661237 [Mycena pura]